MSRDELALALMDVSEGRIPKDRIALRELTREMREWPFADISGDSRGPAISAGARTAESLCLGLQGLCLGLRVYTTRHRPVVAHAAPIAPSPVSCTDKMANTLTQHGREAEQSVSCSHPCVRPAAPRRHMHRLVGYLPNRV